MPNGNGHRFEGGNESRADASSGDQGASPFHDELREVRSFQVGQVGQNNLDRAQTPLEQFREQFPTDEAFVADHRDGSRADLGLSSDASAEDLYKAMAQNTFKLLTGPNQYSPEYLADSMKELGIKSLQGLTEKQVLDGLVDFHSRYSGYSADSGPVNFEALEKAMISKTLEQAKNGTLPIDTD